MWVISLLVEKNEIIPENTPHSIAAGIIYLVIQVFELNITKKDVNIVSGISEVTINKCYKKLVDLNIIEKKDNFNLAKDYSIHSGTLTKKNSFCFLNQIKKRLGNPAFF